MKTRLTQSGRVAHLLWILLPACSALAALPSAGPGVPPSISVGEFAVRLADVLDPAHGGIGNLEEVKGFYARHRITLPPGLDLNASLTESDVITFCSALGLPAVSSQPGKPFDASSAEALLVFLRERIDSARLASTDSSTPLGQGACCEAAGCVQAVPGACLGVFRGIGISCDPDPCGVDEGVCCIEGECRISSEDDCPGLFRGLRSCTPGMCKGNKGERPVSPSSPDEHSAR